MEPIISVQNLGKSFRQYKKDPGLLGSIKSLFNRKYFDIDAVKDISFEIEQGEMIGFIGPNGAGKTTTLKMLSGILYPTSGEVRVIGHEPFKREPVFQKQFALVMGQKSQLWWDLPPSEGFLLNKEIYGVDDKSYNEILNELSELLEVKDIINVPVRKLSLGQRMKCELIASLLHSPKLLFLDEPTIGLDIVVQKKIRQFLKEYNQKKNITMLLTSHYMDDVQELCKRIIVINKGTIIYDGSLDTIIKQYGKEKYLGFVFNKSVNVKDLETFGTVQEYNPDGLSVKLSVPREEHTRIAAEMLKKFPVDDLDISEVSLEEIIGNIFVGQK